jgi:hypothetical protein
MVRDYAETVGYRVEGVRVRLVERLEPALAAIEQAATDSDLVVAFAALSELPSNSLEPPCKLIRQVARAVRRTKASVVVVTDGDEEAVRSTQVGRAVRFYSKIRFQIDKGALVKQGC